MMSSRSSSRLQNQKGNTPSVGASKPQSPAISKSLNNGDDLCVKIQSVVREVLAEKPIVDKLVEAITKRVTETIRESIQKVVDLEIAKVKTDFECKLDELQQYQRRNALRVFGIPESKNEDTDKLIIDLAKKNLKFKLFDEEICRSHRVGMPSQSVNRPIIVKFTSYRIRREVFTRKKMLKGSGITIREDLTATRLSVLQEAMTRFGKHNAWTQDGRVIYSNNGIKGSANSIYDLPPPALPTSQQSHDTNNVTG